MSNALHFFSRSQMKRDFCRSPIPDLIALIEAQNDLPYEDVIHTLKGFQNYTGKKPSEALKQKLTQS
jgi:hypothetical protein